jgi:cell division protein FtsX
MPLFAVLLTWIGPFVAQVLIALGFSVVTTVGLDLAIDQIRAQLQQSAGSLGSDALALFLIAGGGSAIGIVLGAINLRVALWVGTRASSIAARPQAGS